MNIAPTFESAPLVLAELGDPPAPPAPIVTGLVPGLNTTFLPAGNDVLYPPAPPPPDPVDTPPAPPPAITR